MSLDQDNNPSFEALLHYLRQTHGFDFTAYKRASLMRRMQHRMHMLPIESYSAYIDYLQKHPAEFLPLFNTIDINYTSFFRDKAAWDYIAAQIIPQILTRSSNQPIRAWSAGCASGEETYTLAILLAEALGIEQFKARVQIFSTDVDKEALTQARQGSYHSSEVADLPGNLLEKYFEPADERYIFRQDLRRNFMFSQHNLIQDAPMSKIDLLVCRNVLIYFTLEAQVRVLVRFYFGMRDNGFLFLGNTEVLPSEIVTFFSRVNWKQRIFNKLPNVKFNSRLLIKALKRP